MIARARSILRALFFVSAVSLAALSGAGAFGQTAPGESIDPVEKLPALLVVACDDNYPPYVMRDEAGRLVGIVPDQWKAWSRRTGIPVELRGLPWSKAIEAFESGAADVLDTVFETPERREKYDFSPAYAQLEVPIFIHKSISGITSADDLRGFRVAVKSGDAAIGELVSRGIRSLEFFDNYVEIVEAAARLDVRIFCVDKPPALYFLYKLGLDRDFRIAFVLNEGAFHRAVKKGRKELLSLVEGGFGAIPKADYESIDRKWLGAPLSSFVDLRFLALVVAFVAVVFLGLVAVAWMLRRRVAAATSELREKLALLEKSEARNKAFISALPDLFFTFDLEGRFLEVNVSDERKLFMPPPAFLGRRIDDLGLPGEILSPFMAAFAEARETGGVALFEYSLPMNGESRLFEGRVVSMSPDRMLLVARDITDREAQEERLRSSLREKEVLLKEIHHRVKNNMQVISSLMSLQAGAFQDEKDKELSAETQVRIHAMARIHELLYDSPDLASIDAADYLGILARELAGSYGRSTIDLQLESARLTLDEAVPLGLIANELATNALKYAYPPEQYGKIRLILKFEGNSLVLSVEDEGAGLPEGVDPATADSMGFLLVRSLAAQLEAELRFEGPPGLAARLAFVPGREGAAKA